MTGQVHQRGPIGGKGRRGESARLRRPHQCRNAYRYGSCLRDGAGLAIGRTQRVGDLDIDNFAARKLIELRWQKHPDWANGAAASFDQCYAKLLEQKLVTPASIAGDGKLATVFSNYGVLEERLMK